MSKHTKKERMWMEIFALGTFQLWTLLTMQGTWMKWCFSTATFTASELNILLLVHLLLFAINWVFTSCVHMCVDNHQNQHLWLHSPLSVLFHVWFAFSKQNCYGRWEIDALLHCYKPSTGWMETQEFATAKKLKTTPM